MDLLSSEPQGERVAIVVVGSIDNDGIGGGRTIMLLTNEPQANELLISILLTMMVMLIMMVITAVVNVILVHFDQNLKNLGTLAPGLTF